MLGTYVNLVAVVVGSLIGLVLHQRFPALGSGRGWAFVGKEAVDIEGAEVQ